MTAINEEEWPISKYSALGRHIILSAPGYCGIVWFSVCFIMYYRKVTMLSGDDRDIPNWSQ